MTLPLTPSLVDAILAIVALESVIFGRLLVRRGAGRLLLPFLLYLGSGAALLIALRSALGDAEPVWIASALLASGLAHGASLVQSLRLLAAAPPRVHGSLV